MNFATEHLTGVLERGKDRLYIESVTTYSSYPWKRIILTLYLSPALIIKTRCKGGMTFSEAFTVLEKSEKQTMEYDLDVVVNNTCKQLYKQEEMI